jgi:hypothetical protein
MSSFKFPPPPPPPPRASANDAQDSYRSSKGGTNARGGDRGRGRGWGGRGRGNDSRGDGRRGPGNASLSGSPRGAYGDTQPNDGGRGGRGDSRSSGNSRGGYGNDQSRGGGRGGRGRGENTNAGAPRGGYQARGQGGHHQQNFHQRQAQQDRQQSPIQPVNSPPIVPAFPAEAYTNPGFANQMPYGTPLQPQVNPLAFAQAMAFMVTPAGMNTMAAFSNMVGGVAPQYPQTSPLPLQQHQSSPQLSKRKLDKFNRKSSYVPPQHIPQPTQTPQQPTSKPPRAYAISSPAVPTFGSVLPTPPTLKRPAAAQSSGRGVQKKRKVRLGLTRYQEPQDESSNSSDEDADVDEEVVLAEKIINKGLVFEHEGHNISLQTPTEIKAWIKDRRRQYPTAKRIAEKANEMAEKRAGELEFLRRINGDTGKRKPAARAAREPRPTTAVAIPSAADIKSAEERQMSHEKHQAELQQLRKRLHESLAINKAKAGSSKTGAAIVSNSQTINLGLGYTSESEDAPDEDEREDDSSELEDSSVVSSSSDESSDNSDSDSDSPLKEQLTKIPIASMKSIAVTSQPPTPAVKPEIPDADSNSDSPPNELSAKIPVPQVRVPLPPQPSTTVQASNATLCKSWERYGRCNHKKYCKLEHPPKEKKEKKKEAKKLGLFERLVEQEREQADRLALEGIKWLGQNGFLG